MALVRLRDIEAPTFYGSVISSLGCAKSATLSLDSTVLRAKCGSAISERYQGITSLSMEAVVETINPFAKIHPGMFGLISFFIPGAVSGTGFPDVGITIEVSGVITQTVRRFSRNELPSASYTLRGLSSDGVSCPITIAAAGAAIDSSAVPADFVRDIVAFGFANGGAGPDINVGDFCPESVEITEASSLIEDSCQGELWPTYVGVTGLNVTVTATGKGVQHGFDAAYGGTTCLGAKGVITFSAAVGSDTDCAAIVTSGTISVERANITSLTITATSGEIAKISLTWTAHGAPGELTDDSKKAWVTITT